MQQKNQLIVILLFPFAPILFFIIIGIINLLMGYEIIHFLQILVLFLITIIIALYYSFLMYKIFKIFVSNKEIDKETAQKYGKKYKIQGGWMFIFSIGLVPLLPIAHFIYPILFAYFSQTFLLVAIIGIALLILGWKLQGLEIIEISNWDKILLALNEGDNNLFSKTAWNALTILNSYPNFIEQVVSEQPEKLTDFLKTSHKNLDPSIHNELYSSVLSKIEDINKSLSQSIQEYIDQSIRDRQLDDMNR